MGYMEIIANTVKRIPDATVPIGTDLDLRQACCEDGNKNSETAQ
jgi:hypothetical protein